eukprot:TRINITY_DN3514_c0_g2_i1.p1 TRINITY_DN3514_c0_g2~~TRINITY_DN3514_c0_g2_i1.p1  ORF type:complete len:196 (+),score=36.61 TRINITY_DN3514_c0_g2_i1:40-588(+)
MCIRDRQQQARTILMYSRLKYLVAPSKRFFASGTIKKYSVSGQMVYDKTGAVYHNKSSESGKTIPIDSPLEALLGSLCACSGTTAWFASSQAKIKMESFKVASCEGEVDTRGFRGDPNVKTRFNTIKVVYEIKADATQEAITKLGEEVEKRCPVAVMLHAAGVKLDSEWKKVQMEKEWFFYR